MTNQPNMLTHRCGQCSQIFKTETEYLKHKCPVLSVLGEPGSESNSFLKSEPPQIAAKNKKISEHEILKAVIEARKKKIR